MERGGLKVTVDREFFLSFTGADRPWAVWLLAELDAAGYSSVSQLREIVAGSNFVVEMDQAARRARRTLGILSPRALEAPYVRQEWAQRLATDPTAEQQALVLVRVDPCEPEGLLGPLVYIDLVGLDEAAARARLREELAALVRGQRLLLGDHDFPGRGGRASVAEVERPRFPTALPPVWNLPFRRNPAFTGREQPLAELAEQLGREAATAVTQTLQGAGGVGKTALAIEYAYRYRSQFDTVWWVRAEQPTTLVGDYAALAGALQLPGAGQADQQLAVVAGRRWLEEHDRWLLVLDNAEAPDTPTGLEVPLARLVDLLPRVLHGQLLVTSRDASWEDHAGLAELEVFTPDEAVAFLQGRSGSSDQATATQVAELLGLLPLALEQAGAYVRETRLSLADYLARLRGYPALTVAKGRPRGRDPTDTVATTWQVSLERVRPIPGAAALLEVCGFLGPEEIPRELFTQQLDPPAAELDLLAQDPFALDAAVAALRRFGLVKADEQLLSVHRLLQQVRLLERALPFGGRADPGLWPVCARLLPHALAATEHAEQLEVEPVATAGLLESAADYLHGRARYADARRLHERALAIRQARLGADHPDIAWTLSNLALVLRDQGDLAGARRLHEQTLAIREARLGTDHPDTAWTLNNLAVVLRVQGDLAGARRLHERALVIRETRLGADHLDTAWTLTNLADVLHAQEDLADARRLLERALAIREARRGADHPDTAWTLNNLAGVLRDQGDLANARHLLERSLAICEARLGADHPTTSITLDKLARVVLSQGDLTGARDLYERSLAIREARLGADHPNTAWTLDNLAVVLRAQRDLDGARRLHERALAINQAYLGADHPTTAWSRRNLAAVIAELADRQ
jgi:tetratricopeptide (TPR) repeat protein